MGISMDGTLYNFKLRKDAVWQDGEPVTADDVIFTFDLLKQGGGPVPQDLQDFWQDVELVKLDDLTLQFRLPEAFAPFLDYLTFGILPKHLLDGQTIDQMINSPFNLQPVGTGPYRFNHLITQDGVIQGVSLSAFDKYYGQKPYIQEIVFRYYDDPAAALQAYRDGLAQGIGSVTPEILKAVLSEPDLNVYTARQPQLSMVMFNLKDPEVPFLQDGKIRQALLMALNRQWIVDRLLNGQAAVADGPILPGTWAYYENTKPISFDPAAARTLLKDAGYVLAKEGDVVRSKGNSDNPDTLVSLKITLLYPDDLQHKAIAEYIQASWLSIGVQADLEPVAYDQLVTDRLDSRNFQAALVDINLSRSPDPDPYPFWDQAQATGGQNYSQYDSRVASEYLERARTTVNMIDRAKLYRSFQMVFDRDLPALPLYYPMFTYAVDRNIQGIRMGPLFDSSDRFSNVSEWFLASERVKKVDSRPADQTPVP